MKNKLILMMAAALPLFFSQILNADTTPPSTPQALQLYQVGFTKVIFSWQASTDDVGVAGYKVYRGGTEIASTTQTEYTDTGLQPDTTYVYTLKAYDAAENYSPLSSALTIKTLKVPTVDGGSVVSQAVDMNQLGTSSEIIEGVQDALTELGQTGVELTQVNPDVFAAFVQREMDIINEGEAPPTTEQQRAADQQQLDQSLSANFPDNSFLELYLHEKLIDLAESHWQNQYPEAAGLLYDYSLNFLGNHEPSVFNTLFRLGKFSLDSITEESTTQEIVAALGDYKDQMMRFFDFFPTSTSHFALMCYSMTAAEYFLHFPEILTYDDYNQSFYEAALSMSQSAVNIENSENTQRNLSRVSAWELNQINAFLKTPQGNPLDGSIDVVNISGADVYPKSPVPTDEREFIPEDGETSFPVYKGHSYDLTAHITVQDGPVWIQKINNVQHHNGIRVTCDHGQGCAVENLSNPNAPCEVVFLSSQPTAPYNLSAEITGDTFTLSWDWLNTPVQYFKVFRCGILIGTVTTHYLTNIPLRSDDNTYSYTVIAYDTNLTPSDESYPLQVLPPDFNAEEAAYFAWLQKYFGNQPVYDNGDEDNDGLTNLQEYQLGSDPTLAPDSDIKSTLEDVTPGIFAQYYEDSAHSWTALPDFDTLTPFSEETRSAPSFNSTSGNILGSGRSDYLGVLFTGYIDVPTTGLYRFYLTSDEGSRLYLDKAVVINNDGKHSAREYSKDIRLNAGVHEIRLEYFEFTLAASLKLEWAGPNFSRASIGSSNLWTTTDDSALLEETIAWNRDSDLDGITDADEVSLGTNRYNTDTDNDGISDFDEVNVYHTNADNADSDGDGVNDYEEIFVVMSDPNTADINNDIETILVINGSEGTPVSGQWIKQSSSIYATSLNGSLEFSLDLEDAGSYRLEIEGTQHSPMVTSSNLHLELYADDSYCGAQTLTASYGVAGTVHFYLPPLAAGEHSLKVVWNNTSPENFLQINSLSLQTVGGPDLNNNGIPDWIEYRESQMELVSAPLTSQISPVCIEGEKADELNRVSILGFYTPPGEEPVPPVKLHSIDNKWFSNVTLSPNGSTNLTVSFLNSSNSVNKTVTWTETNVLLDDDLTIRLDDSLLLTAVPEGAGEGNITFYIEGEEYETPAGTPIAYKFENSGDIAVNATFTPEEGDPVSHEMTVKVLPASFNGIPACYVNEYTTWNNSNLPQEASIESDRHLNVFRSDLSPSGLKLDIRITRSEPAYVIARLGENGPIMAASKVNPLEVQLTTTYNTVIEIYPDGTMLVEARIVLSHIPANLLIYLHIFVGGVTFDDGTVSRYVTAADFDEYGVYTYRMLRSPGVTTGDCHTIQIYQDGVPLN